MNSKLPTIRDNVEVIEVSCGPSGLNLSMDSVDPTNHVFSERDEQSVSIGFEDGVNVQIHSFRGTVHISVSTGDTVE